MTIGTADQPKGLQSLVSEFVLSFGRWRLWTTLAFEDLRQKFKRSLIGISWILLSFAIFILAKMVIFIPLLKGDVQNFAAYLGVGFFLWQFINTSVVDGCATFITSRNWIKSRNIPLPVFSLQIVTRTMLVSSLQLGVVIVLLLATGVGFSWHTLAALIGFAIIYPVNGFFLSLAFGVIAARFRDFLYLTETAMRVMFFLTPIFWTPEDMGRVWDQFLIYNPAAHYMIAIRDPVLYGSFPWNSIVVVLACTLGLAVIGSSLFLASRRRIVYWI